MISPLSRIDPEQEVLQADLVGLALLVVLEKLEPAERLTFVLHDMFAVPFDDIAPIVERSSAATRQLASRARRRVQGAAPSSEPDLGKRREVLEAFLAASKAGDFEALVAVLHPDVVLRADSGALVAGAAASKLVRGAQAVAEQALQGVRAVCAARARQRRDRRRQRSRGPAAVGHGRHRRLGQDHRPAHPGRPRAARPLGPAGCRRLSQAATARVPREWCGLTMCPSGRSSPVSSGVEIGYF